jgi:DNA-binding MarR family transcriptional regulator
MASQPYSSAQTADPATPDQFPAPAADPVTRDQSPAPAADPVTRDQSPAPAANPVTRDQHPGPAADPATSDHLPGPPVPSEIEELLGDGPACGGDEWTTLSDDEAASWRGFLQAHAEIQLELERELQAEHHLSFSDYFALLALDRAPSGGLRMHDLAKPVRLTRSGLTRLVERLERDGLIERSPCPDDARGTEARITEAGRARVHEASRTHLAGVRRRFLARFSPTELATLAQQLGRLTS